MADGENSREELVYLARLCEAVGRYDQMLATMSSVAEMGQELTAEERNLLSVAVASITGNQRSALRKMSVFVKAEVEKGAAMAPKAKRFTHNLERDLTFTCQSVLDLVTKHGLPKCQTAHGKIFFHKLAGDCHRYLAEFIGGEERKTAVEGAMAEYAAASDQAEEELPPTHPHRLGLALNFSVFYHEILDNPRRAVVIARQAFDEAVKELDTLSEESYRDSTLIMQIMRDNIALWMDDAKLTEESLKTEQ